MVTPIKKTIDLGDGRVITLETGKLAKQADGAVELRMNNTMLLATVVSAKEAGEGVDFMPLQVEYKEKFWSIGSAIELCSLINGADSTEAHALKNQARKNIR